MVTDKWTLWLAFLALGIGFSGPSQSPAQDLAGMKFQKGQKFRSQVDHRTVVSDIQGETKTVVQNTVKVTKLLEVKEFDPAQGIAQVSLKLEKLKLETINPGGKTLSFDSETPNRDESPLAKSLAPLVGKEVALLKVNTQGQVLEVRSEQMPAGRYEVEPVFLLVLPGRPLKEGDAWQRAYNATLDPPAGTGEKFPMLQSYALRKIGDGKAVVELETAWKTEPKTANDQIPLLQYLPKGTITLDQASGLPVEASLTIEREVKDATGPGSTYKFVSSYIEKRVE